jgi:hypothetical protein
MREEHIGGCVAAPRMGLGGSGHNQLTGGAQP